MEVTRDRTQPAICILKEYLGDEYEFKELVRDDSRNQDDLTATRQVRLLPPMSNKVPGALLGALESVFGSKIAEGDVAKAVKKRWPGATIRLPRRKSIPGLPIPMIWGAKFLTEGGLSLPPLL
jgi:hypothetical protein